MHEIPTHCPFCGADWDGGSILETFLKQRDEGVSVWQGKTNEQIAAAMLESYSPPYRWKRCIAVNSRDGDYIQCPDCFKKVI